MTTDCWRPGTSPARLKARATLLRDIREYFTSQGVLEVETPIMSVAGNTDPEIESIKTNSNRYLRTSPEFAHKRLLSAGSGDIYEMGRVFRASETGRTHNPEFTMLEWYRTGFSYHQLMDEVSSLVKCCGQGKFRHWPVEKHSYQELFLHSVDIDPFTATAAELASTASSHGIDELDLDRKQWLDLLLSVVIQPGLPGDQLTFVYDFPADQAALARLRPGSPALAERFELYLGQIELANGYQELTDATEQRQRFEAENTRRKQRGQEICTIDHHLLAALENGLPECAGVALGVDRLLMAICDAKTINEVTAFPYSRA